MSTAIKTSRPDALPPTDAQRRGEHALREALASARIEGGQVSLGAEAIMRECAHGLIDDETAIGRIKALHGV